MIPDFSEKSLNTLNNELRRLNGYCLKHLNPDSINIEAYLYADDTTGLWLGNSTYANAPFSVSTAGALKATSATITGTISATAGDIGGFTIGSNKLTAGTGASAVGLAPGSYPFYSGKCL